MRTIAYKSSASIVATVIMMFIGVGILILGITFKNFWAGLLGALLIGIVVFGGICFFSLPHKLIVLSDDGKLILPRGKVVPLDSVTNVFCQQQMLKGGSLLSWGSVTISTYSGTYRYGSVANCEDVAKELTRLMNEAK